MRLDRRSGLAAMALLLATAPTRGDDPKPWPREFAIALEKSTFRTINAGVALYNVGDVAGCYRLYEGALLGIGPLLKGQADDLASAIEAALAESDAATGLAEKAVALRRPLDRLLEASRKRPILPTVVAEPARVAVAPRPVAEPAPPPVRPTPTPTPTPMPMPVAPPDPAEGPARPAPDVRAEAPKPAAPKPAVAPRSPNGVVVPEADPDSLWARIGGAERVKSIVNDFVFKAMHDPRVKFDRDGRYSLEGPAAQRMEIRMVEFLSTRLGGPLLYLGRPLKTVHASMAITDAEYDALLEDLEDVLVVNGLSRDQTREFMGVVRGLRDEIVTKPAAP